MAKKHYFVNDLANDYTVTPGSKDTICIHGNGNSAYCNLNVDTSEYPNVYSYLNIPTKVGNDLVVKTIFIDNSYAVIKTVTTTIQNYYNDLTLQELDYYSFGQHGQINQSTPLGRYGLYAEGRDHTPGSDFILASGGKNAELTLYSGGSDYVYDAKGNDTYIFHKEYYSGSYASYNSSNYTGYDTIMENKGNDVYVVDTDGGTANIYDAAGKDYYFAKGTYSRLDIYDSKGNDTYETDDNGFVYVDDYKGNDTYRFSGNMDSDVDDYAGKDKYYIINSTPEKDSHDISDYAGKDYYEITNSKGVNIEDEAGNDKYVVKNCAGLDTSSWKTDLYIEDDAGNDVYNLEDVRFGAYDSSYANIYDYEKGNDKYNLNGVSYLWAYDEAGNDKYNITGDTYEVKIDDYAGKDTYNVKGTSDDWIYYAHVYDYDDSSNDKYTFKYVYNDSETLVSDNGGNDTYNLENCQYANIYDYGTGNDKYNIKGMYSDEVYIYDEAGKDTYNAKGSYDKKTKTTNWVEDVYIDDYGDYQDTYNMQYVDYFDIYDYGNTKDIYNIKSSWGWIQDYGGSDVYNIGKLIDSNCRIRIIDTDGDNDILNLSAMKKNNVVLMTDISSGNDFCNNSLIIYDKNSQTFVYIEDFYADENNDGYLDLSGFGVGHIETIKAGGKKLDTNNGDIAYAFDTIRQDVASWLANNTSFSSIQELLRDGTDEQRAYLAAVFENAQSMI